MTTAELLARCRAVSTSTWSDALDHFRMEGVIRGLPVRSGTVPVAGIAVTVKETVGPIGTYDINAFSLGCALDALSTGSMLVIDMGGAAISTFGGLAAQAALLRGVSGVIIDGGCREVAAIHASGLWLSSRHVAATSGKRRVSVDGINVPVTVCGVSVAPGDFIIGDETAAICIQPERLLEILSFAENLTALDTQFADGLRRGQTFGSMAASLRHL
jgi:3-hexulose-6-phosphate synthase/6-phospho-3-hexuloisomerase